MRLAPPKQRLAQRSICRRLIIPEEAKANSAAMSAWIDSTRSAKRRKRGRKTAFRPAGSVAPQSTAPKKRSRKRKADAAAATSPTAQANSAIGTPLRIPYGNKDIAMTLGARYGAGDGMPLLVLIFLLSASGAGCNPADDVQRPSLIRPNVSDVSCKTHGPRFRSPLCPDC